MDGSPAQEQVSPQGPPKILVVLILFLVAYISGAGFYLWRSGGQLPEFLTNFTKLATKPTPTPSQTSKTESSFPIPLDHKSILGARVVYVFDGRIERIVDEPSGVRTLYLISGGGTQLPKPIKVKEDFRVTPVENGKFLNDISAKDLKENDFVALDIIYDIETGELKPSAFKLKIFD